MRLLLLVIIFSIYSFASQQYIKGEMTKRVYNPTNKLWEYEVVATDTTNGKLNEAKFTSKNRIMYLGNIVYCIIEDGELKEIYEMGKALSVKKDEPMVTMPTIIKKETPKPKVASKTWKQQAIDLPQVEVINLD